MSCCCWEKDYDDVSRQPVSAPQTQKIDRDMEDDKKAVKVWRTRSQELAEHRSKYTYSSNHAKQMPEESVLHRPEADQPEEQPTGRRSPVESSPVSESNQRDTIVHHKMQEHEELDELINALSADVPTDASALMIPTPTSPFNETSPQQQRRGSPTPRISPSHSDTSPVRSRSPLGRRREPSPDAERAAVMAARAEIRPSPEAKRGDDALSDVPSYVDSETKERYLMAVKILRRTLIEKEKTLIPSEKNFLTSLLDEPDDESHEPTPSEARVMALETASQILETDPLFDTESDFHVESVGSDAFLQLEDDSALNISRDRSEKSNGTARVDNKSSLLDIAPSPSMVSFGGREYPFAMLGDLAGLTTNVMTPTLFEALRGFFPYGVAEENAWLKFATELQGSNMLTLLSKVRASKYTILAIETTTGDVFGSFTSSPWRIQPSWFGSGEAFLWRLKKSRVLDGIRSYDNDNLLEVYPCTGHDNLIQYCSKTTLGIGGGSWAPGEERAREDGTLQPDGPGIMVDADLQGGETNPCATFENPVLCNRKSRDSVFDIVAMEMWTLTPVEKEQEAERLELQRLFLEENSR